MPSRLGLISLLVICLAGALLPAGPAAGASTVESPLSKGAQQPGARLLSSTQEGVAFEVMVPWEELGLDPVAAGGKDYMRVSLPGWPASDTPGAPALPVLAQAIGAPFGAELILHVEPGPAHTMALPAPVVPAATQRVEWSPPGSGEESVARTEPTLTIEEDPAIYAGSKAYPTELAKVTNDGVIRQQRVAGITVYPVQYNPATQEITVYESLLVRVRFAPGTTGDWPLAAGEGDAEPAAYEQAYRHSLLNYETARAWRQRVVASSLHLTREPGAGTGTILQEMVDDGIPWTPPEPGWRVEVHEEGFYELSYAEFLAAGLPVDTSLQHSTFQIFSHGSEVAIHVDDADEDGIFDLEDSILFYGRPISSKYTSSNVYWLTYGQELGLRMGSRDGTPDDAATPAYYPARRQMEVNAYYRQSVPGADDLERWLWAYLYPPSKPSWSHSFSLAAPYDPPPGEAYTATLTVALLGMLSDDVDPDHHATISLNGEQLGDVWWDGITWQTVQVDADQSLLQAGSNTLSVVAPNDTGLDYDYLYVDRAELEFANTFVAEADVLHFGYGESGSWKFQVDGFTTDQLAVYDITDPEAPVRIVGIGAIGSGPYSALLQDTVAGQAEYWVTSTAYRTVRAIEADTASNLRSTANEAQHIIITHQDFLAQAEQLRAFRASQGWSAMSVDVQDVYDEFGYGLVGTAPIHDFLAYAYAQWAVPPSFVVLVGDGHYDPKDYAGFGRTSFIPPYLAAADPWYVETVADNRYVTVAGDDTFPDMMLGRLAVNSAAEAQSFVDKIVAYGQGPEPGDWQQQVLIVADDADTEGDYAAFSDILLECCLTEPYQATKVYYEVTHSTVDDARTAILGGINAGALIVNYVGHGATNLWAHEGLFINTDVDGLTNGGKLPVILPMTCLDGYYIYPHVDTIYDALGEVVTRAEGKGAIASWSPTGLGIATGHKYLDQGFFDAVFRDLDGSLTLGQATTAGKLSLWASGSNLDLIDTYLLFGDPATGLPVIPAMKPIYLPLILRATP